MNVIQFHAREIREENRERHAELHGMPVTIHVTAAEVQEAFEDLLRTVSALRIAQDAMNAAHARYTRLATAQETAERFHE